MKKKYISMILATLMVVTPLQAAASSEVTENGDTAAYQAGDAAFGQTDFPVQPEEYASAQDSFKADESGTNESGTGYYDPDHYGTGYYDPDHYGTGYYDPDHYGTDHFNPDGSVVDDGPSETEAQFGNDAVRNADPTENEWQAGDSGSEAGIPDFGLAAPGTEENTAELNTSGLSASELSASELSAFEISASEFSSAGDSTAGETIFGGSTDGTNADGANADGANADGANADGANADGTNEDGANADGLNTDGAGADSDAPDELLPDEKKGSSGAGAADSVLTTGAAVLADTNTSSVQGNEGQQEGSFPQSGVYKSFNWKVEEIKPEEAPEEGSESSEDKPSESTGAGTGSGSTGKLKLTIEGNGELKAPEKDQESKEESNAELPESEAGSGTGSDTKPEEDDGFPWDEWKERITGICLGEGVTGIGDGVFSGYTDLDKIRIPNSVSGVTSIGPDAFDGSATAFTILGAFDSFAETYARKHGYSFEGIISGKLDKDLEWELTGERNSLTLKISGSGSMEGSNSWPWDAYRDSIVAVEIGNNVSNIGEGAFDACILLADVRIGTSVEKIGKQAFRNCSTLKSVEFPEQLKRIGGAAFSGCTGLTDLNFSNAENLSSVESSAFSDCISLDSVIIPNHVASLGSYVFYRCSGLTTITLPEGLAVIEKKAFSGCTELGEIVLPSNVQTIGEEAFSGCTGLTEVSAEDSWLQKIQAGAFKGCTRLNAVRVPGCLSEIGASAFELCSSLSDISLPDGIKTVENRVFYNCKELVSLSLPESITSIGDWAFYNCSRLENPIFPRRVRSVGKWAFAGCWCINEINIPDSVEELGSYAFLDCRNLKKIETTRNLKTFGSMVFGGCDAGCVMYGIRGSAAEKYADKNKITFIDRRYDLSNATVTGIVTKVWKKAGVTQSPTVTLNDKKLVEGRDYTLSYRNNRDVGRAEVRIRSAGSYDGFCSRNFKIIPKQVTELKLTAGKNEFKATWKEEKGETLSGYELQYSTTDSFKKNVVTLKIGKASTTWKRVTKLKAGTTYYVRVRAFRTKGSNVYRSKWSSVNKVKTLK